MAANLTIYCLVELTDYAAFETLCSDLMILEGYQRLEPLGGFKDKGRDAIHFSQTGVTTIFAYSVREDWRAKLSEDATKIKNHNHTCDELVFLTTATFTAGERDEAISFIASEFGWKLHLYGCDRLRILLDTQHPQVKYNHPQIFPPDFLEIQSRKIDPRERKYLLISSVVDDFPLADWLARKLTAEGYLVWHNGMKFSSDSSFPADIDKALEEETFRFIPLYSTKSLGNPEIVRQRNLALAIGKERQLDFVLPLRVNALRTQQLDRITASLDFIPFEQNWADGLNRLLKRLDSSGCPKPLSQGRTVAARAFIYDDVLSDQQESLVSNCLRVEHIPQEIHKFECKKEISKEDLSLLARTWAFRKIDSKTFLSFYHPVSPITKAVECAWTSKSSWRDHSEIEGIFTENLVSELIRKSMIVKCNEKGLEFCEKTNLTYFPLGLVAKNRITFKRPDGRTTFIQVNGQRKYWKPVNSEQYKYHLAPVFRVTRDLSIGFAIQVRIRIRLTDVKGEPLEGRKIVSRRKHLCANWWNDDWLHRLIAVCEFLSDDKKIFVGGEQDELLIVAGSPVSLIAPQGINELALGKLMKDRTSLLALGGLDDSDGEMEGSAEENE